MKFAATARLSIFGLIVLSTTVGCPSLSGLLNLGIDPPQTNPDLILATMVDCKHVIDIHPEKEMPITERLCDSDVAVYHIKDLVKDCSKKGGTPITSSHRQGCSVTIDLLTLDTGNSDKGFFCQADERSRNIEAHIVVAIGVDSADAFLTYSIDGYENCQVHTQSGHSVPDALQALGRTPSHRNAVEVLLKSYWRNFLDSAKQGLFSTSGTILRKCLPDPPGATK